MHFEEKKLLKQCQKEVTYEYILAFAGWWSVFWEVVGSGGYILAGGGWWWIYFGWWWMVVGGGIVKSDPIKILRFFIQK